jgi:hypothetical protein
MHKQGGYCESDADPCGLLLKIAKSKKTLPMTVAARRPRHLHVRVNVPVDLGDHYAAHFGIKQSIAVEPVAQW